MYLLCENKPANAFVHLCIERCVHVCVGVGVVIHVSWCVNMRVLACNTIDAELM